jgi:hypothetical protein
MKEKVRKILTVSLFYLDPEVVFQTNDVTLNSSIAVIGTCSSEPLVLQGSKPQGLKITCVKELPVKILINKESCHAAGKFTTLNLKNYTPPSPP